MGNLQTSPQLLGISFIENYKFYFDEDSPNTLNVSNVVKDASQKQRILGEIINLVDNAEDLNKSELIKKLRNIIGKSSCDINISRLSYELASQKKNHDEFVKIIKGLKHEKRQIENNSNDYKRIVGSLYRENAIMKKDNILFRLRVEELTSKLIEKESKILDLENKLKEKEDILTLVQEEKEDSSQEESKEKEDTSNSSQDKSEEKDLVNELF